MSVPFYGVPGKIRQEHIDFIDSLTAQQKTQSVQVSIKNMLSTRPRTQKTIDYHFELLKSRFD